MPRLLSNGLASFSRLFILPSLVLTHWVWCGLLLGGLCVSLSPASAQVTLDGSLGPSSTLSGPNYVIDSTMGTVVQQGGQGNLFHSFGEFNLHTLPGDVVESARFTNSQAVTIHNVLSRVTGGHPSTINGHIISDIPGANFFFLNPFGFLFGPNASLNLSGAFLAGTANSVEFADGGVFSALPGPSDAVLSVTDPVAFGFSGDAPPVFRADQLAAIQVNGLEANGAPVVLVGRDGIPVDHLDPVEGLRVEGSLHSAESTIMLASVASPGTVPITEAGGVDLFDAQGQPLLPALGGVVIAPGSQVDVSGNAAGTIAIRGGKLTVSDAQVLAVTGDGDAAPVGIDIQVTDDANLLGGTLGQSFVATWSEGDGNAGDVVIQAKNYLQKGQEIKPIRVGSTTFGSGDGGNVTVKATESVTVEGSWNELGSGVEGGGTGNGGDVLIEAPLVTVQGGGIFNRAPGDGSGGTLTINADDVVVTSRFDIDFYSVGRVDTQTYAGGDGGNLSIDARNSVQVKDSALVVADTFGTDLNAGKGGNILIDAPQIDVLSGWISASTYGTGQGGSVTLKAEDAITLDHFGTVISQSISNDPSAGDGGSVILEAPIVNVKRGSRISTSADGPANAGNLTVIGTEEVVFSGTGTVLIYDGPASSPLFEFGPRGIIQGTISLTWPWGFDLPEGTTVTSEQYPTRIHTFALGSGAGGDVTIQTPQLLLRDGAFIQTENSGSGPAGNVVLQVDQLTAQSDTTILTTTSGAGKAGSIITQGLGGAGTFPTEVTVADSFFSTSASGTGAGGDIVFGSSGGTPLTLINTTISASVNDVPHGASSDQGLANIILTSPTINLMGGRLTAETTGTRQGGDITITADQSASFTNTAVSVASTGTGNAGDLVIDGGRTVTIQESLVSSSALQASGGNIKVNASEMIMVEASTLEGNVQGDASTQGASISLDPEFIVVTRSHIQATATAGGGGTIDLIGNVVLVDPFSVIDASSQTGVSGSVNIRAPIQNLSGTIAPLPQEILQPANLYASRCVAYKSGHLSSFVQGVRDWVPPQPEDAWRSPLFPGLIEGPSSQVGQAELPRSWADRLGFGALLQGLSARESGQDVGVFTGCRV